MKVQDLQDFVLEKISLTLPQDIILLMKYSGFEQQYNNIPEKIIQFYQKGEHNNLYNFIKTMKNNKNLIYTFSSIDEPLLSGINEDFETEMFGKINKNNIKDIQISSLSAENELEAELEKLYLDEEDIIKIIIFKFNPNETDIMNYIKFFIENHIKEKNYENENKNKKKAFIFSIHMNRIFEADKKDPKKRKYIERNELGELISHLSDFFHIFIDNLNGEDISLIEIMNYKEEQLYQKCLHLEKDFMKYLFNAFSYFKHDFTMDVEGIKDDNYSKEVINYLKENKELRESILKCVLRQKTKERDFFGEILKKNYFTKDDIEIISIVQRHLSELFTDNLSQFVYKSEKDHFLSTFIFNKFYNKVNNKKNNDNNKKDNNKIEDEKEEEINLNGDNKINKEKKDKNKNKEKKEDIQDYLNNKLVKKLIDVYLENLDTTQTKKYVKKIQSNKITLSLGMKLPGMRHNNGLFKSYIKNELSEDYFENEKEMKDLNVDDDNYIMHVNNCKKKIESYQRNVETVVNNNEIIQKLDEFGKGNIEDRRQFFELLSEDYYSMFLSDTFKDVKDNFNNLDEYKKVLKKMVFLRFNTNEEEGEEVDPIKSFAKKMVWLESNNEYVSNVLNIYQKIGCQEKNLFEKIENILNNDEIKYEISERVPEYTKEINSPFFFTLEPLLKVVITDFDKYKQLEDQEFYDFIDALKGINQDALQLVNELCIFSKEVYTLQEFLIIEEKLNNANKSNKENILIVLKILSDHATFINNLITDSTKHKDLCQNIQKLYNFLIETLGNTNDFIELILNIFVNEIKKSDNEEYLKKIVEIILNNNNLISKSCLFMTIIMNKLCDINIEDMMNNLNKIQNFNDSYVTLINNTNNDFLNEIILSIFENKFNSYFESISSLSEEELKDYFPNYFEYKITYQKENEIYILLDKSLEIFKMCLDFLEKIFNNRKEKNYVNIKNEHLCELYCIAYIKMYLYKCIYYNFTKNQDFLGFDSIIKAIEGNAKNNFRKMIKLYVFKIFFYLLNNNYYDFSDYKYPNHQITFYEEFQGIFGEKKKEMLNYCLLPNGEEENYKKELEKFDSYRFNDFNNPVEEFKDCIEKNGIDIYYTISSNIIISNLALKKYDIKEYLNYSSFTKNLFDDQLKLPEITKKLFLLFSNDEEFNRTIKPKLLDGEGVKEINSIDLEVLLYALRFCLQTSNLQNPDGLLYPQLITSDCEQKLNENSLPGNNISNDIYVYNYYTIEKHLKKNPSNIGAYVCSCGLYYDIGPCGFPKASSICANCGKPIGYAPRPPHIRQGHGMVLRKGHYRIFKDQAQKNAVMKYDSDENLPNMLLEEYKSKIIDPIIEKSKYGISKITKIMFENINQKVRKLSFVGYRLLNFILYSHLFYSNCLGFIKNENMNNYLCDGMTCIQMLVTDWNLLKDALQSKGIQIIQIFMNMIFDKICEKIKTCKEIHTSLERENFEEEFEKIIEHSYKEYDEYSRKYQKINQENLQLDKHNMKSLMLENNEINEYDEENYPFYKFFLMTTYPSKDLFIKELKKIPHFELKYPLLTSLINREEKKTNFIKYLSDFNEFVNFMIDNYSYKISREEASKKLIKNEEIYKNNEQKFKDKFNNFIKIWIELKSHATKYGCKDEMPPVDLDENKPLAYFLNDNGEIGKGMYIAAAYQNFIEAQNAFLDGLIEPLRQNGILHHFVKNMEKTIDIQKAKKNEVLNFDIIEEEFMEIIYQNCKRNIYRDDNTINFMNYQQYSFNFDSIEKNLGEIFLPGKIKFNGHENLKFVTYCFEGFRGNKSSVLSEFSQKYKLKNLSIENKQLIYDSIKDKLQKENQDLPKILFSIQLLIYFLTKERKKESDEINLLIEELPEYVTLSKECIKFFEKQKLKIEELYDVYSYIELLCFKPIVNNLKDYYKKKIDVKKKEKILKLFDRKKLKIITKMNLASACRKLISRYLVSTREDIDYNEKNKLILYLDREEMWTGELWKNEEIIKKDLEILSKEEIILGESYELYNILGGDENKSLEGIKLENEKEEENESISEEKIIRKKKKRIMKF